MSNGAYFKEKDWLRKGFELWKDAPEGRQNFISLPAPDLDGFQTAGAEPHDRAALTRWVYRAAMAELLEEEEVDKMSKMLDEASRNWTEHSSRSTLVSANRAFRSPHDMSQTTQSVRS